MKNPLNYIIKYKIKTTAGETPDIDEIYFSKKTAVTRYLDILDGSIFPASGPGSISELAILQAFKNGTIGDITNKVNKFIA